MRGGYNELIFTVMITLVITVLASILSLSSPYWPLPLIGGIIAVGGLIFEKKVLIDVGLIGGIFSFYLLNRAMEVNMLNLSISILIFFTFFSIWVLDSKTIIILSIKKDMPGKGTLKEVEEVERGNLVYLARINIMGIGVSYIGAFISLSSSIAPLVGDKFVVPLIILFGLSTLIILYTIMQVLPKF